MLHPAAGHLVIESGSPGTQRVTEILGNDPSRVVRRQSAEVVVAAPLAHGGMAQAYPYKVRRVPRMMTPKLLKLEMVAESWHSVLWNVPKEVTSLRIAVRIHTRTYVVSAV